MRWHARAHVIPLVEEEKCSASYVARLLLHGYLDLVNLKWLLLAFIQVELTTRYTKYIIYALYERTL